MVYAMDKVASSAKWLYIRILQVKCPAETQRKDICSYKTDTELMVCLTDLSTI